MKILYKYSLLNESQAFLKSKNSWCFALFYSYFFSSNKDTERTHQSQGSFLLLIYGGFFNMFWSKGALFR